MIRGPANGNPAHKSPTVTALGPLAPADHGRSPASNKRRRISVEDEQSTLRANQVPVLYHSPERPPPPQLSSPLSRDGPAAADSWCRSPRSGSYGPSSGVARPMEMQHGRAESHAGLPSLPPAIKYERDHGVSMHRPREGVAGPAERAPLYQGGGQDYVYSHQHASRYQHYSAGSMRPYDRAPFSAASGYGQQHYQDAGRYGDLGGMGMGADAKQRKRRGNLPKETTDKLRSWFVAHLQHPYPTEDEKQDLMRQTGLQMSRWPRRGVARSRRRGGKMLTGTRGRPNLQLVHQRETAAASGHD